MPKLAGDILLLTFIFGVIAVGVYALLLQPRRAQFKKRVQYVAGVKPGTRVQTYGGLVGTITHRVPQTEIMASPNFLKKLLILAFPLGRDFPIRDLVEISTDIRVDGYFTPSSPSPNACPECSEGSVGRACPGTE